MISPVRWLLLAFFSAAVVHADFTQDLVQIHTEAVGGRARVDALKSFRATGITRNIRGDLQFALWAGRPAQIRTELISPDKRVIVQAWGGGEEGPWTTDTQSQRVILLTGNDAEAFQAEAEFDDPLLGAGTRQVSLDYLGEFSTGKRQVIKMLVTQNLTQTSFIYLDASTYLIIRRDVVRRRLGREEILRTDYDDFRPVAGVLLPHRLSAYRDGQRLHETVIERIEPNVKLPPELFAVPPNPHNNASSTPTSPTAATMPAAAVPVSPLAK